MSTQSIRPDPQSVGEPDRYSFAEIAQDVGLNQNTVRSHFTSFSDVLRPEKEVGSRGKRAYSAEVVDKYRLFLVLRSNQIRLSSTQAMSLLRAGHYRKLRQAYNSSINELLHQVQKLLLGLDEAGQSLSEQAYKEV